MDKYYIFAVSIQGNVLDSNFKSLTMNASILHSDNYATWTKFNTTFEVSIFIQGVANCETIKNEPCILCKLFLVLNRIYNYSMIMIPFLEILCRKHFDTLEF